MINDLVLRLNRPFSVRRGLGVVEANSINVNFGEHAVFRFELDDEYAGETIELRVPLAFGIDSGLIVAENEEEPCGNND